MWYTEGLERERTGSIGQRRSQVWASVWARIDGP